MPFRLPSLLFSLLTAFLMVSCSGDASPNPVEQVPPVEETPLTEGDGSSGTITVDPGIRYQTMDGFGTSLGMFDDPHLNGSHDFSGGGLIMTEAQKDTILDLLYSPTKGIGLNRARVHLVTLGWQPTYGARVITDAPPPGPRGQPTMDLIGRATQRNPDFKTGFQIGLYDRWITPATSPLDVATYIKTGLDYARQNGHEPDWVGIQNEPSVASVRFTGANLRDITIALKRLLESDGYSTRVSAPDDINDTVGAEKTAAMLADPEARGFIKSLSIHLYGDMSPTAMLALSKQYGIPLWMTEYFDDWGDEVTWGAGIVHEMIVNYNCAAVDMLFGWLGSPAFGNPGATYITLNSTGSTYQGYKLNPSYYQTGHWSKYVKRGAVRVAAESTNPAIKVSAFTRNGKRVVVLINMGRVNESVKIPAGAFRVIRTQLSGSDRLTDRGVFSSSIILPERSFTTLVER